jgi:4-amino-4-deoxy-L-arabinose transferase-like glycosyltransferase
VPTGERRWRAYEWWIVAAIVLVAGGVRLWSLQTSSGAYGYVNGDDGAYFGASHALVHGALPYRDFLLLHAPGSTVIYAPVAALGQVVGEPQSFAAARLLVVGLGAVSALLAYLAARRVGIVAASVAGGLYAVWFSAVYVERTTLLEPLVNLAVLAALALLSRVPISARVAVAAGACLGAAAAIKATNLAGLAVVVVWVLWTAGRRRGLQTLAGGVAAAALLVLPLALAAPAAAWRMIVEDQAGRQSLELQLGRVASVLGLDRGFSGSYLVTLALVALVVVCAVAAVRAHPATLLWVVLLVVDGALLLAGSLYFTHYAASVAPMLVLILGAGAQVGLDASRRLPAAGRAAVVVLGVAALGAVVLVQLRAVVDIQSGWRFPGPAVSRLVADGTCVTADSATPLILTGVLGRNIERGCPVVVDFTGQVYDTRGQGLDRPDNAAYQEWATDYLLSGDRIVLVRLDNDGLAPDTVDLLRARDVLKESDHVVVLGPP